MKSKKAVMSPQRRVRLMNLFVDGTGTAAISGVCANDFTLTDNGTGDYTLTPDIPFAQAPQVICTPKTASIICQLGTVSTSAIQILTKNLSAVATDADFHVLVVGSDSADQI